MQSFLLLFLITINFLESNFCKKYISRTYMSKRLRFNGRSGLKNNFELAGLCQTDCPGQDVPTYRWFLCLCPKHALSLTGQIFAWKILLSRIFRFFWLCSSRKEPTLNLLWTYSEPTLNLLWTYSEHNMNILWRYAQDLTRSQKRESITESPA